MSRWKNPAAEREGVWHTMPLDGSILSFTTTEQLDFFPYKPAQDMTKTKGLQATQSNIYGQNWQ